MDLEQCLRSCLGTKIDQKVLKIGLKAWSCGIFFVEGSKWGLFFMILLYFVVYNLV